MNKAPLALLAGALFFSSWLQTARMALATRMPYLDGGAAPHKAPTAKERFELSQRLDRATKGEKLDKAGKKAVNRAWGSDAAKMLDILQRSES